MPSQTDYKTALTELVAALKANKALKVETAKISKPLADHVKASIKALKLQIPGELMHFYEQCDGCHIVWREKEGTGAGEINIVPLSETFRMPWKDKLWFDWMKEEGASEADAAQYKLAKTLKGFDVMDTLLDGAVIVALAPPESEAQFQPWYWDSKGPKFPLSLDPGSYIVEAIKYSGLLRWQLFYADVEGIDPSGPLLQSVFAKQLHTMAGPMEELMQAHENLFGGAHSGELKKKGDGLRSFGAKHNLI